MSDLLWPPVCATCPRLLPLTPSSSEAGSHFCPDCLAQVEFMPRVICPLCGRPYFNNLQSHLCGDCQAASPPFSSARSALLYCGPVARSIALLKYHGDLTQTGSLASLAGAVLRSHKEEEYYNYIIPMPISDQRQAERGFNQASVLARAIYGHCGLLINENLLARATDGNRHQASLSGPERRRAMKGHFQVLRPALIQKASLLLFDDVFTTGATAFEAAKTLLEAGAARVEVATVARTLLRSWR